MGLRARRGAVVVLTVSSIVASTRLARAISLGAGTRPWATLAAAAWVASMAAILIAGSRRDRAALETGPPWSPDSVVAIFVIAIVGFVFRSTALDRLPWGYAGVNLDAVYNSEVAFRILDGQQPFAPVVSSLAYARDIFTEYWLALFYAIGGRTIQTLRFACNVVALVDWILLFVILRRYTSSTFVVVATTLLYVFSGPDAIFGLSGMEYILTTPFILGAFIVFERALRTGTSSGAAAGLVWGLGLYSHYPYLFLVPVLPVLALLHFRATRSWLGTFLVAGFVAAVPKLCYLAFNHAAYFQRFLEVARHDIRGSFMVEEHFRGSLRDVMTLLFSRQIRFKTLLPGDPIIPPLQAPLVALGLAIAIRRPTRPEHFLALAVAVFTVLVNLGAFVQDYRVMNAMPIVFLLTGLGLLRLEGWLGGGRFARLALSSVVGLLIVQSVSGYFADRDDPSCQSLFHYGTGEVALARSIAGLPPAEPAYVLVPLATYRFEFFNLARRGIRDLGAGLSNDAQLRYASDGARRTLQSTQQILRRHAGDGVPVRFVIADGSPYARDVAQYVGNGPGVRTTAIDVVDPVSRRTTAYRTLSVPHPAATLARLPTDANILAAAGDAPGQSDIGKLFLETFADMQLRVLRDERQVPAMLDFDFTTRTPYPADWTAPFSLRWSGWFHVATTGEYRIEATYDDGCRVLVDGRLVLDDWAVGGARTGSVTVSTQEGWHRLCIDYFQVAYEAVFALRMADRSGTAVSIPPTALASRAPGAECMVGVRDR